MSSRSMLQLDAHVIDAREESNANVFNEFVSEKVGENRHSFFLLGVDRSMLQRLSSLKMQSVCEVTVMNQ